MKKRLLIIAVIIFVVVVIPIAAFQTIRLVTKPASITREEFKKLPLEQGQELCTAMYDEVYEWVIGAISLDVDDTDWVLGFECVVIENDFYIRHFHDLDGMYVVIMHYTGDENSDGFRIVVADEWYVLEE